MTLVEQELQNAENQVRVLREKLTEYTDRMVKAQRRLATYRLMNDIRLGKILPVVAETGQLADVTFN